MLVFLLVIITNMFLLRFKYRICALLGNSPCLGRRLGCACAPCSWALWARAGGARAVMVRHSRASRSGRWVSRRDPHTRTGRSLDLWWRKKKSNMSVQGQKKSRGAWVIFHFLMLIIYHLLIDWSARCPINPGFVFCCANFDNIYFNFNSFLYICAFNDRFGLDLNPHIFTQLY